MTQPTLQRAGFLKDFICVGSECVDTCCAGWSMQVDDATLSRYKASCPELLDAVECDASGGIAMARHPETDACRKLEGGLCSIHKLYGTRMLSDACYFFPRITRTLGEQVVMSASLACPEIARLAMVGDEVFESDICEADERLPLAMRDSLPEGLAVEGALAIHRFFIGVVANKDISAERAMAQVNSLVGSLSLLPVASWVEALPFYGRMVDGRLPAPEGKQEDPFNLLHALMGLVRAVGKMPSLRLQETITEMERGLEAQLDWVNAGIQVTEGSLAAVRKMEEGWGNGYSAACAPYLRRWLAAQLSAALFPFAGLGGDVKQRAVIIGVRFATLRLALMAASAVHERPLQEPEILRIAQSLARVLDHLADPELSLSIYQETGWVRESRLRAIAGDC